MLKMENEKLLAKKYRGQSSDTVKRKDDSVRKFTHGFRLREDSICIIIGYNSVKTGRKRVDRPRPVSMRNDRRFREKKFGRQQK